MKTVQELVCDLSYSDPGTHIFGECRRIKRAYEPKILGIYGQRLDACNVKIRFAAKSYLEVQDIVGELEHGEFIYFDDASRLNMTFYVESFLIYSRAALDLAVSAYYTYFTGDTNLDSFHGFVKKIPGEVDWLPDNSKRLWSAVHKDYNSEGCYTWIHALVGTEKGLSLRDLVVHKSNVVIDTYIDENDKGRFYIGFTRDSMGHIVPWLDHIFNWTRKILLTIKRDIVNAEKALGKQ
jgi:hypothetical protein